MSFILDALKKSEAERQRQNAPGIASLPQSVAPRATRRWIWLVGVLLLINLVVLAGLLLHQEQPDGPVVAASPPAASAGDADERRPVAPPTVAPRSGVPPRRLQPRPSVAAPAAAPSGIDEQRATPPAAPAARPTAIADGLETLNVLRARGILQLPDMHLDIHVYSAEPQDRFVFINMSKYKENTAVTEGPLIREITPDGVILEYQGTRFLLPRE